MTQEPNPLAQPLRRRVLLVEDHPVVRAGLKAVIDGEPDLIVCAEAEDVAGAEAAIVEARPDLAVVDLMLTRSSGLDLIKNLQTQTDPVPVLALSMHDESLFAERVLRAGAQGYIVKSQAMDEVLTAIRTVLNGEVYLSRKMASRFLRSAFQGASQSQDHPLAALSDRELEVFQLLGQGSGRREVAAALHLGVKTVETHRANIMAKLHLANATELMRYALYWATNSEE